MNLFDQTLPVFKQSLRALSAMMTKGKAAVEDQGKNIDALLQARLAHDMHPFSTQIRFTCMQAVLCVNRFCGTDHPMPDENATDFAALQAMIDGTLQMLDGVSAGAIAAETTKMSMDLPNGMIFDMTLSQYARDWALPQFYFHLMIAYALLRNQGVAVGKADYVPYMMAYLRQAPA